MFYDDRLLVESLNSLDDTQGVLADTQIRLAESQADLMRDFFKTTILEHHSIMNEDVVLYEDAKEGLGGKIKQTVEKVIKWIKDKLEPLAIKIAELTMPIANAATKLSARLKKFGNKHIVKADLALTHGLLQLRKKTRLSANLKGEALDRAKTELKELRSKQAEETATNVSKSIDALVKNIVGTRKNILETRKLLLANRKELEKIKDSTDEKDKQKVKDIQDNTAALNKVLSFDNAWLKESKRALSSIHIGKGIKNDYGADGSVTTTKTNERSRSAASAARKSARDSYTTAAKGKVGVSESGNILDSFDIF